MLTTEIGSSVRRPISARALVITLIQVLVAILFSAGAGEVALSKDVQRRVAPWLEEHGIEATRAELTLKGFDSLQVAFRVTASRRE